MFTAKCVSSMLKQNKILTAKCFFLLVSNFGPVKKILGERISFDVNDLATVKISFLIIKLIIYSSQ